MGYTISLHPAADKDLTEAYKWYEEKQTGLGEKFIEQVTHKTESIRLNPEAFSSKGKIPFREALVSKFPFIIVYKINHEQKQIFISSIHHVKKHPKKKYRK